MWSVILIACFFYWFGVPGVVVVSGDELADDVGHITSGHSMPFGHGGHSDGGGGKGVRFETLTRPQMPPSKWNEVNVR